MPAASLPEACPAAPAPPHPEARVLGICNLSVATSLPSPAHHSTKQSICPCPPLPIPPTRGPNRTTILAGRPGAAALLLKTDGGNSWLEASAVAQSQPLPSFRARRFHAGLPANQEQPSRGNVPPEVPPRQPTEAPDQLPAGSPPVCAACGRGCDGNAKCWAKVGMLQRHNLGTRLACSVPGAQPAYLGCLLPCRRASQATPTPPERLLRTSARQGHFQAPYCAAALHCPPPLTLPSGTCSTARQVSDDTGDVPDQTEGGQRGVAPKVSTLLGR